MLSDVFFPRVNGVSTSIATFRQELMKAGHRVSLFVPAYPSQQYPDDHDVIRVPSRGVLFDPEDRMMQFSALLEQVMVHADDYDIIHIQTPFVAHYAGVKLARKLKLPTVESYHTFFEEYLYHYLPLVPKRLMRYLARHFSRSQCNSVDHLIIPSTPMLEVLRQYQIETPASVIPTGIDTTRFNGHIDSSAADDFKARYGIALHRPLMVHISRVAHEKNIDFIIRAHQKVVESCPEALLLIAGDGPAKPHLKKLVRELSLEYQVMFLGYLDRETELPSCYQAGDLFVFASRTETQGLVLLEAMAMGTPVVSTAVMGTRDILKAKKGAVIAEENETDFAEKVIDLLNDSPRREKLKREGMEYLDEWSPQVMADKLITSYQQAALPIKEQSRQAVSENS